MKKATSAGTVAFLYVWPTRQGWGRASGLQDEIDGGLQIGIADFVGAVGHHGHGAKRASTAFTHFGKQGFFSALAFVLGSDFLEGRAHQFFVLGVASHAASLGHAGRGVCHSRGGNEGTGGQGREQSKLFHREAPNGEGKEIERGNITKPAYVGFVKPGN